MWALACLARGAHEMVAMGVKSTVQQCNGSSLQQRRVVWALCPFFFFFFFFLLRLSTHKVLYKVLFVVCPSYQGSRDVLNVRLDAAQAWPNWTLKTQHHKPLQRSSHGKG